MCSPELQKLTASEPLTLEQEYDMQRCWREDDDSEFTRTCVLLTVKHIVNDIPDLFLYYSSCDFSPSECTFIILDKQKWADPSIPEQECMVGDVNIFLTDPSDPSLAELEIMIAGYRGCSAFISFRFTWACQ